MAQLTNVSGHKKTGNIEEDSLFPAWVVGLQFAVGESRA
jgi:hypothetical protein